MILSNFGFLTNPANIPSLALIKYWNDSHTINYNFNTAARQSEVINTGSGVNAINYTGQGIEINDTQRPTILLDGSTLSIVAWDFTTKQWQKWSVTGTEFLLPSGTWGHIVKLSKEPTAADIDILNQDDLYFAKLWFDESVIATSIAKADMQSFYIPHKKQGGYLHNIVDPLDTDLEIPNYIDTVYTNLNQQDTQPMSFMNVDTTGRVTGFNFSKFVANDTGYIDSTYTCHQLDIHIEWNEFEIESIGSPATTSDIQTMMTNNDITGVETADVSCNTSFASLFQDSSYTGALNLSRWWMSKATGMASMFYNSQITELNVSTWDVSNVVSMYAMFYGTKMTTLDIQNWRTHSATNMSKMFTNSQITTLDVSNFDTSKVTNMSSMFQNSAITVLDLFSWDTSSATNMSNMFLDSKATTLNVSNFNTSNVTNMVSMFFKSKATVLDVSNFNTSKVTNMRRMFYLARATTLDVSNFDTSKVTDMSNMFYDSKATVLDVTSWDISNVTTMDKMFYGVPDGVIDYDTVLINWANNPHQQNVTAHFGGSKYTAGGAAEDARNLLIADGWVITDGGPK